jgi:predicted nucleic acid-binding protein
MAGIGTGDTLLATPLLLPECTSVLRREVFFKRMEHYEAAQLLDKLIALPLVNIDAAVQNRRALDLSRQFQHKKAYDMQYLAVAEVTRSDLVTMDRGLRHAAMQIGVPVRFLA